MIGDEVGKKGLLAWMARNHVAANLLMFALVGGGLERLLLFHLGLFCCRFEFRSHLGQGLHSVAGCGESGKASVAGPVPPPLQSASRPPFEPSSNPQTLIG